MLLPLQGSTNLFIWALVKVFQSHIHLESILLIRFSLFPSSYLVMPFMGTDLGKLMKLQRLSEEKIQYLVYQILKGLKVQNSALIVHCGQLIIPPLSCSVD